MEIAPKYVQVSTCGGGSFGGDAGRMCSDLHMRWHARISHLKYRYLPKIIAIFLKSKMLGSRMIYLITDVILPVDFQPWRLAIPIASAIWGSIRAKDGWFGHGQKKKLIFFWLASHSAKMTHSWAWQVGRGSRNFGRKFKMPVCLDNNTCFEKNLGKPHRCSWFNLGLLQSIP